MESYKPEAGIACYLVVPPEYADQTFIPMLSPAGNNLKCLLTPVNRENFTDTYFDDGTMERVWSADTSIDGQIEFQNLSRESVEALEYVIKSHLPVYVYPRIGGTVQLSFPLVRGKGTDPLTAVTVTDSYAVGAGTVLYLPKQVASVGEKMFPVVGSLPLLPGIVTNNNKISRFPMGMGYGMFPPATNLVKCSSLRIMTTVAPCPTDGWCAASGTGGTWDTDMGKIVSPWNPAEYAFWTTNDDVIVSSYKFDIAGNTGVMNFSMFLRTDGTVRVKLKDSGGSTVQSLVWGAGDGRVQGNLATINASGTDFRLTFEMLTGSFFMFASPQFINGGASDVYEYYPYLGTDTAVYGVLTAMGLRLDALSIASGYARTKGDGDHAHDGSNALAVSGYFQPAFSSSDRSTKRTIAFLEYYTTASVKDIEIRYAWYATGSTHEFAIYSGGTRMGGASFAAHSIGDVFAWVLYSGNSTAGALMTGLRAVNMTTGEASGCIWISGGLMYANRLYVGGRGGAGEQCNGIIGAISVDSVLFADAPLIADRLGDPGVADLFRKTAGRWYYLTESIVPTQFTRESWRGTYNMIQMRTI